MQAAEGPGIRTRRGFDHAKVASLSAEKNSGMISCVTLRSVPIREWILPLLVGSAGFVFLFFGVPYASGYGHVPVPLWDVAYSLWFGFSEWNHGIFVFPLVAVLVFLKRRSLADVPVRGSSSGLLVLGFSIFLYWIGYVVDLQYLGFVALQIFIAGLILWFL